MRAETATDGFHPAVLLWLVVGWIGYALLPWYGLNDNFFTLGWLFDGYPLDADVAPALFLVLQGQKTWLAPLGALLLLPLFLYGRRKADPLFGSLLIWVGVAGLAWFFFQGYAIGLQGWRFAWLTTFLANSTTVSSAWATARCS